MSHSNFPNDKLNPKRDNRPCMILEKRRSGEGVNGRIGEPVNYGLAPAEMFELLKSKKLAA